MPFFFAKLLDHPAAPNRISPPAVDLLIIVLNFSSLDI